MVRETRFQFDDPQSVYIPGIRDPFGEDDDSVLEEYHPGELKPQKKKDAALSKKSNPKCETQKQKPQKNSPADQVSLNPDPDEAKPKKAA